MGAKLAGRLWPPADRAARDRLSGHNPAHEHDLPAVPPDRRNRALAQPAGARAGVDEPAWPGFCRVVWNAHVAEMTDLAPAERDLLMKLVYGVESALRRVLAPTKINLASLGNQVPHLHWHVIPRFADDAAFPDAIWAAARRTAPPRAVDWAVAEAAVRQELAALGA